MQSRAARIETMELDPQIRLICQVGGIILFSAAQMHSSVPNTSGVTRFSMLWQRLEPLILTARMKSRMC